MGTIGVEVTARACAIVESELTGEFAIAVGADFATCAGVSAGAAVGPIGVEVATRTCAFVESELAGEFAIAVGADLA